MAALLLVATMPVAAQAETICTIIAEAESGNPIVEDGDCTTRVTPASTFKVALAVMGFESGILTDAHAPVLDRREGDADWGGEAWKQPADPTRWLKYSIVWYSQQIARKLGAERLTDYASSFGYGNADFSGDPGKNNGLERAWIASSLKISPAEQVTFLRKLANRTLPVSPRAMDEVNAIVEVFEAGGWDVHGKTGSAFPRKADGSFDRARGYGWFVGWAEKGERRVVFARLDQGQKKQKGPAGIRVRDALLAELPGLMEP
jgi:beta-lactamase class D